MNYYLKNMNINIISFYYQSKRALPLVKDPRYPLDRRPGGSPELVWNSEKRKDCVLAGCRSRIPLSSTP
jgi:hypothetical protein